MRPTVTLLTNESANQIIEEGFALLEDPGIELHNQEALELLLSAGAKADSNSHIVRIPERVAPDDHQCSPNIWHGSTPSPA
ncbi:MAG: hypothetical protein KAS84_00395 [Anaerolineales bacterium]|nr:hypothetical protein [Anaerolineales bacterium]